MNCSRDSFNSNYSYPFGDIHEECLTTKKKIFHTYCLSSVQMYDINDNNVFISNFTNHQ